MSLLSESKMKPGEEHKQSNSWFECPAMGSATWLHLTQVQDRPAEARRKLTNTLSVERGSVISRRLFCITNIFLGLHIIFICKNAYTKKGGKIIHIHNMI